jgi:hypothetical protein
VAAREEIPGYYATVRQDTRTVIGIVGERYRIVQNDEAFQFVDQVLGSELHFRDRRQGDPKHGPIVTRSVLSGTWQARADAVWEPAKLKRITLHEVRDTYASFLTAADTKVDTLVATVDVRRRP